MKKEIHSINKEKTMDKLQMQSKNLVDENIEFIAKRFPNCVTEALDEEGKLTKLVDFDMLKQELSHVVIDGDKERYTMTWPDKKQAILTANAPIAKTLRPCREESVDFDHTQNLYIEGDNLDVLKLLRETYLGKIKMIYIDPPYNTGNDFVYNDDFAVNTDEYLERSNQVDDQGNRMVANNDSNGRFHTDWLNMIYPRLKLAKDLLTDDGAIFISIDDNEIVNLTNICNEIFGISNYVATFIVASNSSKNNAKWVSVSHEYILCFAKNKYLLDNEWSVKKNNVDEYVSRVNQLLARNLTKEEIHNELLELVKKPRFYDLDHFTYADEDGVYQTNDPGGVPNGNFTTEIIHPITNKPCAKPTGGWRFKDDEIKKKLLNNEFEFGKDETTIPRPKRYLQDFMYQTPKSILFFDSQSSTKWLKNNKLPFDFPKAVELIKYIISMIPSIDIVLDFFSGSATTAHAVMQLNAEDGGNRKYICVQLPEKCDEKSEAYKAGYKTICEIGKERIRRAGKKIKEENPNAKDLDIGFRDLKLDSSCMKDIYYSPNKTTQDLLTQFEDNIKEDRTPEDLLFQVMLDMGVMLSSEIKTLEINGKKVFNVNDGDLVCCFDKDLNDDVVTAIAKMQPLYAVFRDASMSTDSVAVNFDQIFETYSPTTTRKVI